VAGTTTSPPPYPFIKHALLLKDLYFVSLLTHQLEFHECFILIQYKTGEVRFTSVNAKCGKVSPLDVFPGHFDYDTRY
jgi:hypothetical protein